MKENKENELWSQVFGAKLFLLMISWPQLNVNEVLQSEVMKQLSLNSKKVPNERFMILCDLTLKEYHKCRKKIPMV